MYYVYRFLNQNNETIYIGRTKNLKKRIEQEHFASHGHLPVECYKETKSVQYIKLTNQNEMIMYEIYLIDKYSPKYNIEHKQQEKCSFELPEKEWITYKNFNTKKEKLHNAKKYKNELDNIKKEMENITNKCINRIEILELSFDENIKQHIRISIENIKNDLHQLLKLL